MNFQFSTFNFQLFLIISLFLGSCSSKKFNSGSQKSVKSKSEIFKKIIVGAAQMKEYLPILKGKKVALVVNQTSMLGEIHLVDTLLKRGVNIVKIFAPEHGFRGSADAGEKVKNSTDVQTGLPIISLYGKNKKPTQQQLSGVDIVIFDIQDVGVRFYTYISTMHYVMEACAANQKKFIVLDRPNPNGFYVDGVVLDLKFQSFVGMHPIPIVHGLTVGELAEMINGENWLKSSNTKTKTQTEKCHLIVVKCKNYSHKLPYSLPVKPSPNLPNDKAIALYPSICLFEPTQVSVGRGTDLQFQIIGSPEYPDTTFSFTPRSKVGAKYPKHKNTKCYGKDLRQATYQNPFFLTELILFYRQSRDKKNFFNNSKFLTRLAGTDQLQKQIESGFSETQIRQMWKEDLDKYREMRKKYLLYEDF